MLTNVEDLFYKVIQEPCSSFLWFFFPLSTKVFPSSIYLKLDPHYYVFFWFLGFFSSKEGEMRILRSNNFFTESDSESGTHQFMHTTLGNPNCRRLWNIILTSVSMSLLKPYYMEKEKNEENLLICHT